GRQVRYATGERGVARGASRLERSRAVERDHPRQRHGDRLLSARQPGPATFRRRRYRARSGRPGGLPRCAAAHRLDQHCGDGDLRRPCHTAGAGDRQRAAILVAADIRPGSLSIVDVAAGAHGDLDHRAAEERAGECRACLHRPRARTADVDLHALLALHRHGAGAAAADGSVPRLGNAARADELHEGGALTRRTMDHRVAPCATAVDHARHPGGRRDRLRLRARLLHHANAGRRARRPDDLLLHCLLYEHDAQLGARRRAVGPAAANPPARRPAVLDGTCIDPQAWSSRMKAASIRSTAMYAYAVLLLAFILVPLLIIVPMSLTSGNSFAFPTPGYSTRWYQELLDDPRWFSSFINSVVVALAATFFSSLLGIPAAIGLVWGHFPGKRIVYAVVAAPLVAPVVIVGVAAFSFFAAA